MSTSMKSKHHPDGRVEGSSQIFNHTFFTYFPVYRDDTQRPLQLRKLMPPRLAAESHVIYYGGISVCDSPRGGLLELMMRFNAILEIRWLRDPAEVNRHARGTDTKPSTTPQPGDRDGATSTSSASLEIYCRRHPFQSRYCPLWL